METTTVTRKPTHVLLEKILRRSKGEHRPFPQRVSERTEPGNGHVQDQDKEWSVRKTDVLRPPLGFCYEMILDLFFNARHFVVMDGQQGPEHPHSYRVQVRCRSRALHPQNHVLVGYQELRERVKQVIKAYNGTLLNELPVFRHLQPTTENLAGVLYQQLNVVLKDMPIELVSVTVWESPTEGIVFRRDDAPSLSLS